MASRVKEDEKNERIIRGLLKLPDNRRCANCNSLGPQYVCTNFWTFVCTTCSGIHREFTHRVKSISMAKFTPQEVSALQEGGNQRSKQIYFKEWDPQRQSLPDSSNVERLRDFIKHVYVDRRYTGERSYDKPPRVKTSDKEDSYENRRTEHQGGSRSPPYEDSYEHRYSGRSSPGGRSDDRNYRYGYDERRSPGYEQESRQYGDYKKTSPARAEVVNDWRRDDRFGNDRKFGDQRMSDGDLKLEGRSPERMKDPESSSPPIVRPVREILGENVLPLRISEPPKANGGRAFDGSIHSQRTASSSSLGSTNENPVETKLEKAVSLIDFDADPEPQPTAVVAQAQQRTTAQTAPQPASTNDNNWASFDFAPEANKVSQAPSNLNTLESVFSQLSMPASVPGQPSGAPSGTGALTNAAVAPSLPFGGNSHLAPVGHTQFSPFSTSGPVATHIDSFATFPPANTSATAPGLIPARPNNSGSSFSMQHQQPSFFQNVGSQSTAPQLTSATDLASSNKPWDSSFLQNAQRPPAAAQAPQAAPMPVQGVTSGNVPQPSSTEVKPSGRKELPEDLFAALYSSVPTPIPSWQTGAPHGMGFAMPYNTAMPMPSYQQAKSSNPFDLNNESRQVQPQTFPSMGSLQGALHNAAPPSILMHTSNLGTQLPGWTPPQSSHYPSAMPSQPPTYASTMEPRAYMGPQVPGNMSSLGHQGMGGLGNEGPALGYMNTDHQMGGRYQAPANSHLFPSAGGNPFG